MTESRKTIFHMSDIHIGEAGVRIEDFRHIIDYIEKKENEVTNPLLLITGDLTSDGLPEEFEAFHDVVDGIDIPTIIVPGNHDERNYGAARFEEFFGSRFKRFEDEVVAIYAADSAEPDNDAGHVGRAMYSEIEDFFSEAQDKVRIFALHHHLVPVPHTGREFNVVEDSGDVLGLLTECNCHMVLNGHRHVPWMWHLNDMLLYNTGTLLSRRIRGAITQVHTHINIYPDSVEFIIRDKLGNEKKFAESDLTF
ncbi:MAG: metallophosphoesterase [Candidatus Lokiarchaeota archaeon]|nr:metallophosphoesterase [Candidatus Lokiarchaeota archaeon]